MVDHTPHWSQLLAPLPAPDPFANKNPVNPWPALNAELPAQGYW